MKFSIVFFFLRHRPTFILFQHYAYAHVILLIWDAFFNFVTLQFPHMVRIRYLNVQILNNQKIIF